MLYKDVKACILPLCLKACLHLLRLEICTPSLCFSSSSSFEFKTDITAQDPTQIQSSTFTQARSLLREMCFTTTKTSGTAGTPTLFARPPPSIAGWWQCCRCKQPVNPALGSRVCPICGHGECPSCPPYTGTYNLS
ncbi:uncharacterized protein BDV17DRAFT_178893 [Aspergillus undulatus]|uniref:uncharacterized protein n=1 Tax=Aspergillus undulatus TaxID=1810928 RepID=UPI003CCDBF8C